VKTVRLALVVQRYGEEVNGGAEQLARQVAEQLVEELEVTVLTTCALDYRTWENHYAPGHTTINGVQVIRFPVAAPRAPTFDAISEQAYAAPTDLELGRRWMDAQGPLAPDLAEHLRAEPYDVCLFVGYLYATTAHGLPEVGDRAILVPTMHDEPPLRLRLFDELFRLPRLLLFITSEERELARARFAVSDDRAKIVGAGVHQPPPADGERFRTALGTDRPYVLCVGRLDASKGVDDLVACHASYRRRHPDGLDLVLVGGGTSEAPDQPWLHLTGFVPEPVKHDALAGAAVVALPSPYESLSLAQVEAWSHGKATLSTARSPVLVGQSRRAGAGLWYDGEAEYAVMLDFLARAQPLTDALGRTGRRYARREHAWDGVLERWLEAIHDFLAERGSRRAQTRSGRLDELA
jgi:glycosyltransferase involved in cell wall biosynthesis